MFLCVPCVLCGKDFLPARKLYPSAQLCYNPAQVTITAASTEALNNPPTLVPAFDDQDRIFSFAFSVLQDAISARAFPAASIAVTQADRLVALRSFGHFIYEADSPQVNTSNLFDLASLTKVIATTTMAAILYQRGQLELEAPVAGVIPEFLTDSCGESDRRRSDVTFHMLLAHSSGLPAYEKLFLKARSRDALLQAAFTIPLTADPGTHAEYSDIGFLVLGAALERIAGEPLDIFCQREIFGPLAMTHTTFNPPAKTRPQIPPTADEREGETDNGSTFRNKIIQGEVQDENAFVLGGVAPHAGLFSTAEDLARFAHALLHGEAGLWGVGTPAREMPPANSEQGVSQQEIHPILRPETVALFTRRDSAPPGTSRALGWDTPSGSSQSGKYFGPHSFGHLGYTGTSLWIDPDRQLSISLLTNRTWPDCANHAIKQVRPKFHDAIIEAIG
jgi:CubicO group peptidase (beta-lactamase class C family)